MQKPNCGGKLQKQGLVFHDILTTQVNIRQFQDTLNTFLSHTLTFQYNGHQKFLSVVTAAGFVNHFKSNLNWYKTTVT